MGKNKQLIINLVTTLFVLAINIVINFGLSSYIVQNIGKEAYGFISLANNFISYATIITVALNSMASRFITIELHKGNTENANKYFSSVLIANIILIAILIIPSLVLIGYLDSIIKIPAMLVNDVKILFLLIFFNFFVSLIGGVFTVATYCTNKLYLSSIKNMESSIIKLLVILTLFIAFKPSVFFVGIATLIAGIYIFIFNIRFTNKLLPDIKIKKKYFSKEKIKILLSSGLWNSLTNLGNVLADGLDLLISNIAIDASTMGIIAIAKVPSNVLNTVLNGVANVFQPQIIQYYSKDDIDSVVNETKKSMKICGVFGNIPFAYILVFGGFFCYIWMPSVDNNLLKILCAITFINVYSAGVSSSLYNIFTITNKVKWNAILNIFSGIISTVIVIVLLYTTNFGIYAIVGISALIGIIKALIIIPIYGAKCLNVSLKTFFPTILKYILTTIIMAIMFYFISKILIVSNILSLIYSILICGIVGIITNYFILLDKYDRIVLIKLIKNKLGGK